MNKRDNTIHTTIDSFNASNRPIKNKNKLYSNATMAIKGWGSDKSNLNNVIWSGISFAFQSCSDLWQETMLLWWCVCDDTMLMFVAQVDPCPHKMLLLSQCEWLLVSLDLHLPPSGWNPFSYYQKRTYLKPSSKHNVRKSEYSSYSDSPAFDHFDCIDMIQDWCYLCGETGRLERDTAVVVQFGDMGQFLFLSLLHSQ